MEQRKNRWLMIVGIAFVIYWLFDFWYSVVLPNDYSWLLWYSSAGFLLTGIALIVQNTKLSYSLFCALFVIESLWAIDLVPTALFHASLFGSGEFVFSHSFDAADIFFTLYHVMIPIGLFILVLYSRGTYKYGWVGALIFAFVLMMLTYFLVQDTSQVNCLYSSNACHTIFSFLYNIENPYRIFAGLFLVTIFIFIPTNYTLVYFKNNFSSNRNNIDT